MMLLEWSISNLKRRILHHQKHGKGSVVIKEKAQLQKVQRMKDKINAI